MTQRNATAVAVSTAQAVANVRALGFSVLLLLVTLITLFGAAWTLAT